MPSIQPSAGALRAPPHRALEAPPTARRLQNLDLPPVPSFGGQGAAVGGGGGLISSLAGAMQAAKGAGAVLDPDVLVAPGLDPFAQWLRWEVTASFEAVRRPFGARDLPVVHVPAKEVTVRRAEGAAPGLVQAMLRGDGTVAWPKHPDNTAASFRRQDGTVVEVPYFDAEPVAAWRAWHTASRSIVVEQPETGAVLSVKLPTDHPTPHAQEAHKVDMVNNTVIAVRRGEHVLQASLRRGDTEGLVVLPDVMSVAHDASGNGIVVRDISALRNPEVHYLPGFALPKYGAQCAAAHGCSSPAALARDVFAPAVGRAKANLLLQTGLWSKSPHGQNLLLELDLQMRPTGGVAVRDLADTSFVGPIARALGFSAAVEADVAAGYSTLDGPAEDWAISIPGLDHDGYFSYGELVAARPAHDRAFCDTLRAALDGLDPELDAAIAGVSTVSDMGARLASPAGARALRAYAARREARLAT